MNYISFAYKDKLPIFIWKINNDKLLRPNEILEDSSQIRILFDFPFRLPKLMIHAKQENEQKGWTRLEILTIISRTYKQFYKEEVRTMTVDQKKLEFHPRIETNGIHGIYDHDISSIVIKEMMFDFNKDYWRLGVITNLPLTSNA